jgi:hypothetical protein
MKTQPTTYQIRVQGHFDNTLTAWFDPLAIVNEPTGEATLTGPVRDQADLFGILLKFYNLNFNLIAVQLAPVNAAEHNPAWEP